LEKNPKNWEAIRFFPDCGRPFEIFLRNWKNNCADTLKPFVIEVAEVFDVRMT
jgi:hypothetical protein